MKPALSDSQRAELIRERNRRGQQALRQRRRALGLVPVAGLWAHPDDAAELRAYAREMLRARAAA